MSGSISFNQSSRNNLIKASLLTQMAAIPEAPVFSGIPDIDSLFEGDVSHPLLDLQPSQWLPSTQPHEASKPKKGEDNLERNYHLTEKNINGDITLGSQYPVIHSINTSQLPAYKSWKTQYDEDSKLTNTYPSFTEHNDISYGARNTSGLSQMKYSMTDNRLKTTNNKLSEVNSMPDVTRNRLNVVKSRLKQGAMDGKRSDKAEIGVHPAITNSRTNPQECSSSASDIPADQLYTPSVVSVQPMYKYQDGVRLRSVAEISQKFHQIFRFPHFNIVQSKVFDDMIYTDKSVILCSPTGSGKTAVFEMAIVRLLSTTNAHNLKVVYMAPIKALCSERYTDWKEKFEPYNLKVMELTGDTENDDFFELQKVNIILTTPEKWDSMTRKWRDNKTVMQAICLFLVDEIHVLNDPTRGAVVEAVISRMKTIQASAHRMISNKDIPSFRFVALSATITNIEDIASWLGSEKSPAVHYMFDDSARPVRLRKVVLGYHFSEGKRSEFQFDISLSYKLSGIINTYNDNKPTLIFCATRKGVMQAADILAKDVKNSYLRNSHHRLALQNYSFHLKDAKLRDLVSLGIGYHHAGMDIQDRKEIEEIFANGDLPVLVATSTLAMGVNLPAHLVIVKSTMYYNMGALQEYSDTQMLQMIGRAGRPQFDTSATAVIMTKNTTKSKYENLINGTQVIESSLHKNLIEHLNAEIVLNTITDISVAVEWIKYTFLYIRVMKNPVFYGIPCGLAKVAIDRRLQDLCMKSLNQLNSLKLVDMNNSNLDIKSTVYGRLMARYYISFKTAELFLGLKGDESIIDLIGIISKCEEFEDIKLRVNEKSALNSLNKDKNRITIRYSMNGKIKSTDMKVNCLIQATLGCLLIHDFALQQDAARIFKAGVRVTRCLSELVSQGNNFRLILSSLLLCKCFKAKLWENSKFVSKQLDGIGPTHSTALVNAGLTSFEKLEQANPREIELIVNRHPPFGNQVKDSINRLPKYEMTIEQISRYNIVKADIVVTIILTNKDDIKDIGHTSHTCTLVIGDEDNVTIYKQWIMDAVLIKEGSWSKKLEIKRATKGPLLNIHYISQEFVGLDVECTYTPYYLSGFTVASSSMNDVVQLNSSSQSEERNNQSTTMRQPCHHSCHNKMMCAHECCKIGVAIKSKKIQAGSKQTPIMRNNVARHIEDVKRKAAILPATPGINKKSKLQVPGSYSMVDLTKYRYNLTSHHRSNDNTMYRDQPENVDCIQPDHQLDDCKDYSVVNDTNEIRYKNTSSDWDTLNMYIEKRENITSTDNNDVDFDEPNMSDVDYSSNQEIHFATVPTGNSCSNDNDDYARETDYGLIYVHGGQQEHENNEVEISNTVKGKRNYKYQNFKPSKTLRDMYKSRVPTRQKHFDNQSINLPNIKKQSINQPDDHTGDVSDLGDFTIDYEIDDYSDESFEAVKSPQISEMNRSERERNETTTENVNTSSENVNADYDGNVPANDFDYNGPLFARPLFKTKAQVQTKNALTVYPSSGENSMKKSECVGTYSSDNEYLKNREKDDNVNDNLDSQNDEDVQYVPEDELCNTGMNHGSKWVNFFSSQSSTASDCVNFKYPSWHDRNEIVMKSLNDVHEKQSLSSSTLLSSNKKFTWCAERCNVKNNTTARINPMKSDVLHDKKPRERNDCGQYEDNAMIKRSSTCYPDYSSIFDDIL